LSHPPPGLADRRDVVVGRWKVVLIPAAIISPRAVAERCEDVRMLLRRLGDGPMDTPPDARGGGSPPSAEARVWAVRPEERGSRN
jgi:hypothetical protein